LNYFKNLFAFFDVDYFAAFIHPGFGIDAMRLFGLTRIFIGIKLRRFKRIVRPACARSCV
jgi:hypothetical protein